MNFVVPELSFPAQTHQINIRFGGGYCCGHLDRERFEYGVVQINEFY